MAWKSYGLDREAQKLVLAAKQNDPNSLNQSYKMRMAIAYGLERFWGEQLRLRGKEQAKADYWKATWDAFVEIVAAAGLEIPNDDVDANDTAQVLAMSARLWQIETEEQRVALAVLMQLCDCLVWWTQRYK
ncbi:hypothetical protein [Synechococcus sp. PCC 7336]|uniref:hypothetical protein n=1 Tax=Synechococcus sp. PCC 7336 TaxID=195250 RepID=UPI0003462E30|nr:hypothetical protein [Synechococcus sp. PCC 7336]